MSKINDGGAAFPRPAGDYNGTKGGNLPTKGMTLRDYFAAKAMQAMLSDSSAVDEDTGKKLCLPEDEDSVAFCSYSMADAMLKAREAKNV